MVEGKEPMKSSGWFKGLERERRQGSCMQDQHLWVQVQLYRDAVVQKKLGKLV